VAHNNFARFGIHGTIVISRVEIGSLRMFCHDVYLYIYRTVLWFFLCLTLK